MSNHRNASLILKTSDLTANSITEIGEANQYMTSMTWYNINLRTLLGDISCLLLRTPVSSEKKIRTPVSSAVNFFWDFFLTLIRNENQKRLAKRIPLILSFQERYRLYQVTFIFAEL